jgi:integrase
MRGRPNPPCIHDLDSLPAKGIDRLSENNERDRVLSPEEYTRLLAHCDDNLRPIVLIAYHTGMRRGEIFGLTWDMVGFEGGIFAPNARDL